MKKILIICFILCNIGLQATPVSALSCLPTDMYLDSIIGEENVIIFAGTVKDTVNENNYTAEILLVNTSYQGYIEKQVMVYHAKHPDWGYLCNTGPAKKDTQSVYVTTRNDAGQYNVSTRLELESDLFKSLKNKLEKQKITGEVVEFSAIDRQNQILTTIMDLLLQITTLLKEKTYWSNQ